MRMTDRDRRTYVVLYLGMFVWLPLFFFYIYPTMMRVGMNSFPGVLYLFWLIWEIQFIKLEIRRQRENRWLRESSKRAPHKE